MKLPKTVKGMLGLLKQLEVFSDLKDFDELSEADQDILRELGHMVSNQCGELSPELRKIFDDA